MKLELKHLSAYLPYGLKCKFESEDFNHLIVGIEDTIDGVSLISPFNDYGTTDISSVKPILRPLSDLTKEIEHNGEKFIPIDWLFENVNEKLRFSDDRFMDYDDGKSKDILHYSIYDVFSDSITIDEILILTNKIFEWHFDVFGLIEQNLAIDINTI